MRQVDLPDFKSAKKKITKRLKVTKDLLSLSTTLKNDIEKTKSIIQLMNEQILVNKQSPWKGYDIMFYLPISTKKRSHRPTSSSNNPTASSSNNNPNLTTTTTLNRNHDRYLFLIKRPESSKDLFLLKVTNKENELDVKNSYDLKHLHSIDYGSEELELVLSLDAGDYSLYFLNQSDRDELTWILASIAKMIVGINEFTLGYSIDFEALTYMMTTSGTFIKFPQLNKMISLNNAKLGYQFSNDEAEAEHILDELNWSNSVTSLADIHHALSVKSSKLNDEIIDFLLQWEEMDYNALHKNDGNSIHGVGSKAGVNGNGNIFANASNAATSAAAVVANVGSKVANVANAINPKNFINALSQSNDPSVKEAAIPQIASYSSSSLKDTGDVLVALKLVDEELSSVEVWLEEQTNRLSEIQSNLFLIEDESAALETSWQSLNRVQEVITFLMAKYTLTENQEKLLRSPEIAFNPILKSSSLNSQSLFNDNLIPIFEAAKVLRQALIVKITDSFMGLKSSEWKQIQAISAINNQKQKLHEISGTFCGKFGEIATNLFDWLLKHRTLIEGEASLPMIIPRSFQTKQLLEDLNQLKMTAAARSSEAGSAGNSITHLSGIAGVSVFVNPDRFRYLKNNQLLQSQRVYHLYVTKFTYLLDILMELSPKYVKVLIDSYRNAVHERLYTPLIKAFVKDIKSMINYLQLPINLNNCKGYRIDVDGGGGAANLLQVTFHRTTNTNKIISSWKVLEVVLLLISPIIENEEAFVKKLFHISARLFDRGSNDTDGGGGGDYEGIIFQETNDGKPNLDDLMSFIFDGIYKRIFSISAVALLNNTNMETDGIEAIALLTVLNQFLTVFLESINQLNSHQNTVKSAADSAKGSASSSSPTPSTSASVSTSTGPIVISPTTEVEANETTEANLYSLRTLNNRIFLFKLFDTMKETYEQRINAYKLEQIKWIQMQKADPKSPLVLIPFHRYPTFVLQICEMCNGEKLESVEDLIHQVAKEIISWLNTLAKQSDKYGDKMKIINYLFFHRSISSLMQYYHLQLTILQPFLTYAIQQVQECSQRYLHWMIEYEFSSLSALANRLEGVGSRVSDEELSLYIRRKDVLNVIKELEGKTLESMVINLKKRLEKHFRSEFDTGLNLTSKMWEELKERMVNILTKLDTAASVSYQIKLDIGPKDLLDLFEKHKP